MDTTNVAQPNQTSQKGGGFTKWAMVFGIAILLNLFFYYVISLVYVAPVMNYDAGQVVQPITDQADCVAVGGQWTDETGATPMPVPAQGEATAPASTGYCDPNYTKEMQYDSALKAYQRNVFIILISLGVILLVLGAFLANIILALAFSWAGVFSIIIASMRYWGDAANLLKVLILAAALAALIWVASRKAGK